MILIMNYGGKGHKFKSFDSIEQSFSKKKSHIKGTLWFTLYMPQYQNINNHKIQFTKCLGFR